jgi:hypothetical protein
MSVARRLRAAPWHDPHTHATCRALRASFATIRAEGLALLAADDRARAATSHTHGAETSVFAPYSSKALKLGEWADVGLYFNGCVNAQAAARAPRTTALLASDMGGLARDAVSCPLGSAYFSLLRPHTQVCARPHHRRCNVACAAACAHTTAAAMSRHNGACGLWAAAQGALWANERAVARSPRAARAHRRGTHDRHPMR